MRGARGSSRGLSRQESLLAPLFLRAVSFRRSAFQTQQASIVQFQSALEPGQFDSVQLNFAIAERHASEFETDARVECNFKTVRVTVYGALRRKRTG